MGGEEVARLWAEKAALERHVRELGAARAVSIEQGRLAEGARAEAAHELEKAVRDRDSLLEQNARLVQVVGELKGLLAEYKSHARRYKTECGSLKRQLEDVGGPPEPRAESTPPFQIPLWGSPAADSDVTPCGRGRRSSGTASAAARPSCRWSLDATQTPPSWRPPPGADGGGRGADCAGEGSGGGSGRGRGDGFKEREPEPEDFLQTQMKKRRLEAGRGQTPVAGRGRPDAREGADEIPVRGRDLEGAVAHVEVVRGEDARAALPGHDCPACAEFWSAVGRPPPPGSGECPGADGVVCPHGGGVTPAARCCPTQPGGPGAGSVPAPRPVAAPEDPPRFLGHQPHTVTGVATRRF